MELETLKKLRAAGLLNECVRAGIVNRSAIITARALELHESNKPLSVAVKALRKEFKLGETMPYRYMNKVRR